MLDALVRQLFAQGLRLGYVGNRPWGYPVYVKTEFLNWFFKTYRIFLKIPAQAKEYSEYADAFLFGEQSGGGFEIVVLDAGGTKRTFMRLYAGAVLDKDLLKEFGITPEDVIAFLKRMLLKAGDKTRLDQSFMWMDDKWQYDYQVVEDTEFDPEVFGLPLLRGSERILFCTSDCAWHRVLRHFFIFVEVK